MFRTLRLASIGGLVMAVCAALLLVVAGDDGTPTANAAPPPHAGTHGNHGNHGKKGELPDAAIELHDTMRKLWEDHITWTRLFIVSDVANLPDLQATTDRLLRNQDDIGNAIKPYYGEAAGEQLTALLREHILLAADILTAAKDGDSAAQQDATAKWYANADDIARFLSNANPSQWGFGEMRQMMRTHLDLTLKEAVAHLTGDFAGDVAAYEEVHEEILEMADLLSSGIVAQFPDMF